MLLGGSQGTSEPKVQEIAISDIIGSEIENEETKDETFKAQITDPMKFDINEHEYMVKEAIKAYDEKQPRSVSFIFKSKEQTELATYEQSQAKKLVSEPNDGEDDIHRAARPSRSISINNVKNAVVNAVYRKDKPKDKTLKTKDGGLAQTGISNQADIYFNYFSERVPEKENDKWVKIYLPELKEAAEDFHIINKTRSFK